MPLLVLYEGFGMLLDYQTVDGLTLVGLTLVGSCSLHSLGQEGETGRTSMRGPPIWPCLCICDKDCKVFHASGRILPHKDISANLSASFDANLFIHNLHILYIVTPFLLPYKF